MIFVLWKYLNPKPYAARVYSILTRNGFDAETAKRITAKAAHETGDFKSVIFKENNNLFGMKLPRIRPTTATGENRGHATYKSIDDSVRDYILYYNYMLLPKYYLSIEHFVNTLKSKRYFEDNTFNYLRGVTFFYNKYFAK